MNTHRDGEDRMRSMASQVLARIDGEREILHLIETGLDDEQIISRSGAEPRIVAGVRQEHQRGEEIRPVTPYELGLRRFMGQISTEEMMDRLRSWPYTFGQHHYDFYDEGSWDEVRRLESDGFITLEEFQELKTYAEQVPGSPYG